MAGQQAIQDYYLIVVLAVFSPDRLHFHHVFMHRMNKRCGVERLLHNGLMPVGMPFPCKAISFTDEA
ncbi:hypothetical protein Ddc_03027 [Ditylenchus destructor]|nr:hypothetical protein Ddc_03027 [Ditylenchus destructor]